MVKDMSSCLYKVIHCCRPHRRSRLSMLRGFLCPLVRRSIKQIVRILLKQIIRKIQIRLKSKEMSMASKIKKHSTKMTKPIRKILQWEGRFRLPLNLQKMLRKMKKVLLSDTQKHSNAWPPVPSGTLWPRLVTPLLRFLQKARQFDSLITPKSYPSWPGSTT